MEITRRDALKMASSAAIVGGPSAATAHDATAKAVPQGADLEFDLGIPTPDTVEKLYDTMDFQRAVQGYLWAVPIVGMEGARRMLVDNAEARSGDLV
ncbi:twin-arginine translocation signal domain-containing protein, partial [Sinorhizobium meliloti]